VLVLLYLLYLLGVAWIRPAAVPAIPKSERTIAPGLLWRRVLLALLPPLLLIVAVLGSILWGIATPTEAASVGAVGAILLAWSRRRLNLATLREVMTQTTSVTSMVFLILIGAALFSLVFRGFQGDELVTEFLSGLPGGT